MPCVDGLWERCSWELVFSVPRVLSYEQETEQGIEVEEFPVVVVASGELIEQVPAFRPAYIYLILTICVFVDRLFTHIVLTRPSSTSNKRSRLQFSTSALPTDRLA